MGQSPTVLISPINFYFLPKNAMELHFDKSFCPVFSKTGGVLGQRPKVLMFFGGLDLKPYCGV